MDELASEFDTAWKEALEWFFEPFLAFFFPPVHGGIDWNRGHEFMDKELQQVVPEAATGRGTVDKLVKVWTPEGQQAWVLIHVEVQSQHDADFAERMYVYNHRLRDKYGRMPVSLAVLGDESPSWRPDTFREGRWGCEVRFAFPAVKLVDYKSRDEALEADANPFACVALVHLKAQETKDNPTNRYDWKLRLVKGLYDRGLNKVQMVRLFNVIDWVIKLPRIQRVLFKQEMATFEKEKTVQLRSPMFQDAWEEGQITGLQRAIELGLKRRLGQAGLDLVPLVKTVTDVATLESITESLLTAPDLDAVRSLLPPSTPS